jgi:hypothetical protein
VLPGTNRQTQRTINWKTTLTSIVPDFTVAFIKHGVAKIYAEIPFRYRIDQQDHIQLHNVSVLFTP